MLIGINNLYQIKQIHEITDASLIQIDLDVTAEKYPFKGWNDERILCYCYKDDGKSISIYPYIDDKKIEEFENEVLSLQAQVVDLQIEVLLGGM